MSHNSFISGSLHKGVNAYAAYHQQWDDYQQRER